MASNPPFQVEDTDEDFFDKLVDDEFEGTGTSSKLADGSDSDEAKAFSNLKINDQDGSEVVGGAVNSSVNSSLLDANVEDNSSLMPSSSIVHSGTIESNNPVIKSEIVSESTTSNNDDLGGSGVKEVQWSLFNTESEKNGGHGFGSFSDFFNDLSGSAENLPGNANDQINGNINTVSVNEEYKADDLNNSINYGHNQETQNHGMGLEQNGIADDLSNSQDWENLYPGWRYDHSSGEWYQVDGYEVISSNQGNFDNNSAVEPVVSDGKPEISYLQQTAQSVVETVTNSGTVASVSNWSQEPQVNNGYPEHMIFDPQYPGWYYDTIALEWRLLDTYVVSDQTSLTYDHHKQNMMSLISSSAQNNDNGVNNGYVQADNYGSQGYFSLSQNSNLRELSNNYDQLKQEQTVNYGSQQGHYSSLSGLNNNNYNQQTQNGFASPGNISHNSDNKLYGQYGQTNNSNLHGFGGQVQSSKWGGVSFSNNSLQNMNMLQPEINGMDESISYSMGNQQLQNNYAPKNSINNHGGNFSQQLNQANLEQNQQRHFPNDHYNSGHNFSNFTEQSIHSSNQSYHAPSVERSSDGRPPHALVTFGFGGKLIVMKDNNSFNGSSYENKELVKGSISIVNMMEVITEKATNQSVGVGGSDYFRSLCHQSFPGPLVGGNPGSKELNKWIDDRIANYESVNMDYRLSEALRLLLSLLKIACQYYGKLRSPIDADTSKVGDFPEAAVAKLFASAKRNGAQVGQYGALTHCLQNFPSESQIRATASEVQNLLVSGRMKEALHCAQEGQLWGPALVIASQIGDQFYGDTVKQMALRQLVPGTPLRTLCLLIAGQPADVFSPDAPINNGVPAALNLSPQPAQFGANGMLDDWEENLAVITANRTKDDELVLIHLGDCLWKERSEITAAHICYIVADTNFESYSDSARLCLVGADHWKHPRVYASPEAIQRTELYEYSKVLGNSQFTLLTFQPYKLVYAHMLAEVGKVSDAMKYCQAVLKSLKTSRAPEVEMWKQLASSLQDRIRTHQQGGHALNLAPAKLVGKFLNFFDSTTNRVVGGLPPPVPSTSHGNTQGNEFRHQQLGSRVSTSQSTMAMSSLMSPGSAEPTNEKAADSNRMTLHNRSASEPNFATTPRQVDLSKNEASANAQGKSRFGFGFGSQLLQKTVGLVLKPRGDRQAKLGETNKFYYDEKLKRWVEEGTDPPAEVAALAPPPTTSFQNGVSNPSMKSASNSERFSTVASSESINPSPSENSSGMPPIPPGSSSHFSARGRMGVRSRYVDTFNQGGGSPANTFQSPPIPSVVKPATAKFFVPGPAPASSEQQIADATPDNTHVFSPTNENPSTSFINHSFQSPTPSSTTKTMQRFPSMDNFTTNGAAPNGPLPPHSRRTASWGGFNEAFSPPKNSEVNSLGEVLGMSTPFMPNDLHEVEL